MVAQIEKDEGVMRSDAPEGRFINRKAKLHEVWDSLMIRNARKP